MVERLIAVVGLLVGAGVAIRLWRIERIRQISRERLLEESFAAEGPIIQESAPQRAELFLRRYRWVAIAAGLVVALLILMLARLNVSYAIMFGVIAGMIAFEVEGQRAARTSLNIEVQL